MSEIAAQDSTSPPAGSTIADRLRGARSRGFVGRAAELELFRFALEAPEPPFSVLWISGPGGVGKTTLLGVLADAARLARREPVLLDLRAIEPSPPAFAAELARALGTGSGAPELGGRERPVLLLDTFETAAGLEDWLREEFLPALPAGALAVIAGRDRPAGAWREDPGWRELLRVVSLRNLDPVDARVLLRRAQVADELHGWVLELTHGHPLALSLLLDVLAQRPHDGAAVPRELGAVPDVLGRLVASFVAGVPSPRHRLALELTAHARFMTAGVLRAALGDEQGEELFTWLRGLSFIECGARGLFPHDLAREVIDADLRWRDAAAYARVHGHVRADVVERLMRTEGREHQNALADLMFLHRGNPAALAFWDWKSLGQVYADDAARPGDREAILAMVERHEGSESGAIAAHWLERRPEAFVAFRGRGSEPVGFLAQLPLHAAGADDLARDPGARALWAHAQRHAPARPGDEVLAGRFSMDRDAYQAPSRSFNVVTMRSTQEWLKRPRLAWYYIVFADPDAVAPLMAYIGFQRAPDADYEVGGRRYGVYARDWRREGGAEWLDRMAERELGGEVPAPDAPTGAAEPLALSQAEFAGAVRRALRDLHSASELAANPLVRARVVRERGGEGPAPEALRELVEQAVDELRADPRAEKLVRALDRTYLRPAPTQESAAELLGLPFSTYRGHLTRGVARVVEWFWQRELYGHRATIRQ